MSATPALARATTRVEHVLARRARDDGDAVDARDDVAGVLRVELAREDSARDDSPRAFECECALDAARALDDALRDAAARVDALASRAARSRRPTRLRVDASRARDGAASLVL